MFVESAEPGVGPKVKICGITNAEDARAAIECGADALGFNFFPGSKRYIDIKFAAEWIGELPDTVEKISILVDPDFEQALATAALPFITALQLHGGETPEFCGRLAERRIRFAKALPVTSEDSLRAVPSFATNTLVLDSSHAGEFGGSGHFSEMVGHTGGRVNSGPLFRETLRHNGTHNLPYATTVYFNCICASTRSRRPSKYAGCALFRSQRRHRGRVRVDMRSGN